MSSNTYGQDPIQQLADDYLMRRRRGEALSITEYCDKLPDRAKELKGLLRTMELMEKFPSKADSADQHTPFVDPQLQEIGGYRIICEIGRGGMGIVYEAEHLGLARRVALKVLPQQASQSESSKQRFERESRTAAKMHHTNIVPVFEVGYAEGYFFYAMQLIQGRSLDHVIEKLKDATSDTKEDALGSFIGGRESEHATGSRPSLDAIGNLSSKENHSGRTGRRFEYDAATIVLQAAEALTYSHARDVIHRDIKPSNLILDESGVVWLTDFGLAKTEDDGLTRTGDFLGTLRYMAPERFAGHCDARSDIYALGLTLYELLTQRAAHQTTDRLQLVDAINNVDPPRPRSVNSRVPRDLETIVLTAIEKQPKSRYKSARAMADDLGRFLRDEPIQARRASTIERVTRWARRNKRLAVALCGIVALFTLVAIREVILRHRAESAQHVAVRRGEELQRRGEQLEQQRSELRRNLYFAEMNLAGEAASDKFGAPTVHAQLLKWKPQSGTESDYRGWEWYYLYALTHREQFASTRLNGVAWSADFHPSGDEYVHCVNGWGIHVRNSETHEVLRDMFLGSARYVQWSPNGKRIAVSGFRDNVNVCDADTLEVVCQIGGNLDREVWCVSWSHDSTRLATCRRGRNGEQRIVRIWEASTGELLRSLKGHTRPVSEVRWCPDGTRLATVSDDIRVWDAETGKELLQIPESATTVCWSPDGKTFATGDDTISVWDAASGARVTKIKSDSLQVTRLRWRPHTQQLASSHHDGTVALWDIKTGWKSRTFYGHTDSVRDVAWNPQGSQIVSSGLDSRVRVWDIGSADQTQVLPFDKVSNIDWSNNGNHLTVCGVWASRLLVCKPKTGDWQVIDESRHIESASFSPDDRRIAYAGRGFVRIWDTESKQSMTLNDQEWFDTAEWNHDGSRLAASSHTRPELMIWNTDTGELIAHVELDNPTALDWSPDGTRLSTSGKNGFVNVLDSDGSSIWKSQRENRVSDIRWSPDGSQLASAESGAIVLWNPSTGEVTTVMNAVREEFGSLDWSPDARRLATGSSSSVRIWDPASGLVAIKLPIDGAACVCWSRDGRRLAAASEESGVYIWDASRGYAQVRIPIE